jgi:hypothetical protein
MGGGDRGRAAGVAPPDELPISSRLIRVACRSSVIGGGGDWAGGIEDWRGIA